MAAPNMYLRTESGFEAYGATLFRGQDIGFAVGKLEGWRGVERERKDIDLQGDGEFPTVSRLRARKFFVEGRAIARTWRDLEAMADKIESLPRNGDRIFITELGDERYVVGGVDGRPMFEPDYRLRFPSAHYAIDFKAPDPLKYGEPRPMTPVTIGGVTELRHFGTAPAPLEVIVRGPVSSSSYSLTLAGRTFTVVSTLGSTAIDTIDMRTGIIRNKDGQVRAGIGRGSPLVLPPGVPSTLSTTGTGGGTVEVRYSDTYY